MHKISYIAAKTVPAWQLSVRERNALLQLVERFAESITYDTPYKIVVTKQTDGEVVTLEMEVTK
jgi:hypothetical protein